MSTPPPRVAIVGASGYVGRALVGYLGSHGRPVLALGRRAGRLPAGEHVTRRGVDVADAEATAEALRGVDVAYYLAHAMGGGGDFPARDRLMARSFARAAANAGVSRIVYLGGLGRGRLSEHLASRQEVGALLGGCGVPVVELRAAVVLGAGSISFEMLRYLTERLPMMVCPRWVNSRVQPLAERDLMEYLRLAASVPPGVYEIGGPDTVTYGDLIQAYAQVRGLRRRRILRVPVLTPWLSSWWVDLVTPVDVNVSHSLIDSLRNDVVVDDPERTATAFGLRPAGVFESLSAALDNQVDQITERLFDLGNGLVNGVHSVRCHVSLPEGLSAGAELDLRLCGGSLNWYGWALAWWLRLALGRVFGERLRLYRPRVVEPGARVDWWTVRRHTPHLLVLLTTDWFCGEAWLGYRITGPPRPQLEQVGALRPLGLLGWVYWRLLWPVHLVVFRVMAHKQTRRARALREPARLMARAESAELTEFTDSPAHDRRRGGPP